MFIKGGFCVFLDSVHTNVTFISASSYLTFVYQVRVLRFFSRSGESSTALNCLVCFIDIYNILSYLKGSLRELSFSFHSVNHSSTYTLLFSQPFLKTVFLVNSPPSLFLSIPAGLKPKGFSSKVAHRHINSCKMNIKIFPVSFLCGFCEDHSDYK